MTKKDKLLERFLSIPKPHPGKIINSVYLKNIKIDLTLKQIL